MKIVDERETQKNNKKTNKDRKEQCCGGVQMFKNMRLVILFDMFLNPSFKLRQVSPM